jgi:hypothetical protein
MVSIDGNLWRTVNHSSSLSDDQTDKNTLSMSKGSTTDDTPEKMPTMKPDEKTTVSHFAKNFSNADIELSRTQNPTPEKIPANNLAHLSANPKKESFNTGINIVINEANRDSDHWARNPDEGQISDQADSFDFDTKEKSEIPAKTRTNSRKVTSHEKTCEKYDEKNLREIDDLTASEDSDKHSELKGKKK